MDENKNLSAERYGLWSSSTIYIYTYIYIYATQPE